MWCVMCSCVTPAHVCTSLSLEVLRLQGEAGVEPSRRIWKPEQSLSEAAVHQFSSLKLPCWGLGTQPPGATSPSAFNSGKPGLNVQGVRPGRARETLGLARWGVRSWACTPPWAWAVGHRLGLGALATWSAWWGLEDHPAKRQQSP